MITAGASGIGEIIAQSFVDAGARVHVCDISAEAIDAFKRKRPEIGVTRADVSIPAKVDRFFDEALNALGGLDILVNNAGIAGPTALIEDIAPADWQQVMSVNINGQFYCVRRQCLR